ncbi:u3 snornp-associated protein utp7 [Pelomyxa schiedti]|nr:u3 snornp-associated protein utp7 [Pelomyxa schiedti]
MRKTADYGTSETPAIVKKKQRAGGGAKAATNTIRPPVLRRLSMLTTTAAAAAPPAPLPNDGAAHPPPSAAASGVITPTYSTGAGGSDDVFGRARGAVTGPLHSGGGGRGGGGGGGAATTTTSMTGAREVIGFDGRRKVIGGPTGGGGGWGGGRLGGNRQRGGGGGGGGEGEGGAPPASKQNTSVVTGKKRGAVAYTTRWQQAKSKYIVGRTVPRLMTEHNFRKIVMDRADKLATADLLLPQTPGFIHPEPEEEDEPLTQFALRSELDLQSAQKVYQLHLDKYGPYMLDYTRNGQFLLLGGRKGHLGVLKWPTKSLITEINVNETIRAVKFLHDETMFAVAQKKHIFIYDSRGVELHCLREHFRPRQLEFLPYHWLLVSAGYEIVWRDTSTGHVVACLPLNTQPTCITQNPTNAVVIVGSSYGRVSMWAPACKMPVMEMKCHQSTVTSASVDQSGMYLATAGADRIVKLWDLRTDKPLHQYTFFKDKSACPTSLSISQKGLLACAIGHSVVVWQNGLSEHCDKPYLTQDFPKNTVTQVKFAPYEDFLGVTHTGGFFSMVVPGSGEPNFDTLSDNPFQTRKERQDACVRSLMDKIPPTMISLNPNFVASYENATVPSHQAIPAPRAQQPQNEEEERGNPFAFGDMGGTRYFTAKNPVKKISKSQVRQAIHMRLLSQRPPQNDNAHLVQPQPDTTTSTTPSSKSKGALSIFSAETKSQWRKSSS